MWEKKRKNVLSGWVGSVRCLKRSVHTCTRSCTRIQRGGKHLLSNLLQPGRGAQQVTVLDDARLVVCKNNDSQREQQNHGPGLTSASDESKLSAKRAGNGEVKM